MERSRWTDERLDDRFDQIERRFDRVDDELRMIRSSIDDLRQTMIRVGGAGYVTLLAAILVRGG